MSLLHRLWPEGAEREKRFEALFAEEQSKRIVAERERDEAREALAEAEAKAERWKAAYRGAYRSLARIDDAWAPFTREMRAVFEGEPKEDGGEA